MLDSLHTNFLKGSYLDDRTVVIKVSENNPLFLDPSQTNIPVTIDSVGNVVIGYGCDLFSQRAIPKKLTCLNVRFWPKAVVRECPETTFSRPSPRRRGRPG